MDFAKIISTAQASPDAAPEVETGDLFEAPPEPAARVVDDVPHPAQIPGFKRYKLDYKMQRFVIGKELEAIDQNMKVFKDVDDSVELCAVLNKTLKGEAVLFTRKDSILQDGTVVVWLEWGVPSAPAPSAATKNGDAGGDGDETKTLTLEQLMSPQRNTKRSRDADELDGYVDGAESDDDDDDEEGGESNENEDDW